MSIIKKKSKKANAPNIKAEIDGHKASKMAKGGEIKKSGSQILSEVAPSQPKANIAHAKQAALQAKKLPSDKEVEEGFKKQSALRAKEREEFQQKQKLAEGGEVKKPKVEFKSGPKMAQSQLKVLSRDEADRKAGMKAEGPTLNYKDLKQEMIAKNKLKMAEGGEVEESAEEADDQSPQHIEVILKEGKPEPMHEHFNSVAEAIRAKKKMAEGGLVDIEENNEEQPNEFYEQNEHEAIDWDMDSGLNDMDQPMDSNLDGDDLNSNERDMISKLRAKMAVKRALK